MSDVETITNAPPVPDATALAVRIRDGFVAYDDEFRAITQRARARFEQRDLAASRRDAVERIDLYDRCVTDSVRSVRTLLGAPVPDRGLWRRIKVEFATLVADCSDIEFFKTWFSSITRRVFQTVGVDPDIEFLGAENVPLQNSGVAPVARRTYTIDEGLEAMFRHVLDDFAWSVPYADPDVCAQKIADRVRDHLREHADNDSVLCLEVLPTVFYRDTRAYLVGRTIGWTRATPVVLAFENADDGIRVDAVIQSEHDVSILFGFARSYFHADLNPVDSAILFLRRILPHKPVNELFTVLGRAKQGKTERYRSFARHLDHSLDRFIVAPGAKGMVMLVFTLPSFDIVFKVIRDRFAQPKQTTRDQVKSSYELVFKHDKAGRLVDTQEFRRLEFHRDRFTPELLEELLAEATSTIRLDDDHVVIEHAYVERRLRPLNLYLQEVGPDAARRAVLEYGHAMRDLAVSNIFPGDLLLKNFGVSRHGRVIFYDYDELCLLTDCKFRDMPVAANYEDEMSAEPWFHVGPNDVFPEEFAPFLGLSDEHLELFKAAHGELLTAEYWRGVQARIRAGEVLEVLPY